MPAPVVSVVMPAFNAERYIAEAIDSIRAQTFDDFELIAVNDGSTDRTASILRDVAADEPRLIVIENDNNLGIPQSRNIGLSAARGEYIAAHDADDRSMPERLATQVEYLNANPDIALVGSAYYKMSADGALGRRARLLCKTTPPQKNRESVRPAFDDLLKANHFVQGSVMLRARVAIDAGRYNERFACSEDYDLWLRIAREHQTANLLAPLYALRGHAASATKRNAARASLYHHLAIDSARGNVGDAVLAEIKEYGIERYYPHLAAADKARYHKSLANTFYRNKRWSEALREYRKLKGLGEANVKAQVRIALLRLRLWSPFSRAGESQSYRADNSQFPRADESRFSRADQSQSVRAAHQPSQR